MLSGVANVKRGEKIRSGYLTLAFSGAKKRAEVLHNPCILSGPQRQARGENQKRAPQRIHIGGVEEGASFLGLPNAKCGEKIRNGYLIHAFSRFQNRAEVLSNPCLLGGPQCQGRGEHQQWLPHRCLFGVQKKAVHSRGSPTPSAGRKSEGDPPLPSRGPKRGRFILGGSQCQAREENQKWLPHPCWVRKRAEIVNNPCILGGPQRQARGENQNWLPQRLLIGA